MNLIEVTVLTNGGKDKKEMLLNLDNIVGITCGDIDPSNLCKVYEAGWQNGEGWIVHSSYADLKEKIQKHKELWEQIKRDIWAMTPNKR